MKVDWTKSSTPKNTIAHSVLSGESHSWGRKPIFDFPVTKVEMKGMALVGYSRRARSWTLLHHSIGNGAILSLSVPGRNKSSYTEDESGKEPGKKQQVHGAQETKARKSAIREQEMKKTFLVSVGRGSFLFLTRRLLIVQSIRQLNLKRKTANSSSHKRNSLNLPPTMCACVFMPLESAELTL